MCLHVCLCFSDTIVVFLELFLTVYYQGPEQSMIDSTIVTHEWINPFDYLWFDAAHYRKFIYTQAHTHILSIYKVRFKQHKTLTHSLTNLLYILVWIIYIRGYLINWFPLEIEMKWSNTSLYAYAYSVNAKIGVSVYVTVSECTQFRICLNESNIWHDFFKPFPKKIYKIHAHIQTHTNTRLYGMNEWFVYSYTANIKNRIFVGFVHMTL